MPFGGQLSASGLNQEQSGQAGTEDNHRGKVIRHGLPIALRWWTGQDQLVLDWVAIAVGGFEKVNPVSAIVGRVNCAAAESVKRQLIELIIQNTGGRVTITQ